MNLASNTKTVIFDDKIDEVIFLREALDKLLIPNLYIKFDEAVLQERDESDKLTNVRFVFADILIGTKKEADSKVAVEAVVSSILEHISKENGPFILILWSKDTQAHKTELIRTLRDDELYNFIPITDINKTDYIKINGVLPSKSVNDLIVIIKTKTDTQTYFNLLREWESETHKSTAKTFDLFVDNENTAKTKDLLNGAIKSVVGTKQAANIEEKRKALWNSLNTILQDAIEKNSKQSTHTDIILESLDLQVSSPENVNILNSKLLFETAMSPTSKKMYPGNIFCFNSYINICNSLKQQVCGYKDQLSLLEEVIDLKKLTEYFATFYEAANLETEKKQKAYRKEKIGSINPILMEFTPYCDYSQKGYKKSRLIFGFLIPIEYKDYIYKSTKYIYYTSNFKLEKNIGSIPNGDYFIVLNIKHIFGVNPTLVEGLNLLFRARKELVNDIQHNIAYHISRVGVTSL